MDLAARRWLATRDDGRGWGGRAVRELDGGRRSPSARYAGRWVIGVGCHVRCASLMGLAARLRLATRDDGGSGLVAVFAAWARLAVRDEGGAGSVCIATLRRPGRRRRGKRAVRVVDRRACKRCGRRRDDGRRRARHGRDVGVRRAGVGRRCAARRRGGASRLSHGTLAARARCRAGEGAARARREDPRAVPGARDARSAQRRQADRRRGMGSRSRRAVFRVLRRRGDHALRARAARRRQRRLAGVAPARRALRADRSVELPVPDRCVEGGAGARGGEHGGAETRERDALHRVATRRARDRSRDSGRRAQRDRRSRRPGRRRARGRSRDSQGLLHGRFRKRRLDPPAGRAGDQTRVARTRRQVGERGLRRRRSRRLRREVARRRLRQCGAGLLRAQPDPGGGIRARRARCEVRGGNGAARRRRSARSEDAGRLADLALAPRTRRRLRGGGEGRGRAPALRRRSAAGRPARARRVPDARGLRRRHARDAHRARGDLRPGRRGVAVPRRSRGDRTRQRLDLRRSRVRSGRATRSARCASRARSRPA